MNCSMMLKNSLIFLRLEIVYSRLWRIVPHNSYFSTRTQTTLGAQGSGPYRLFAITIGHVSAIFKHYKILCLEKRPHTHTTPATKKRKMVSDLPIRAIGNVFFLGCICVTIVERYVCTEHRKNASFSKSKYIQSFIKFCTLFQVPQIIERMSHGLISCQPCRGCWWGVCWNGRCQSGQDSVKLVELMFRILICLCIYML